MKEIFDLFIAQVATTARELRIRLAIQGDFCIFLCFAFFFGFSNQ